MEFGGKNLEDVIIQRKAKFQYFTEKELYRLGSQLSEAFACLEKIQIAHGDIKPENILIQNEKDLAIKVCDIGSGRMNQATAQTQTIVGTRPFMAPELYELNANCANKTQYNAIKSDVYSLGLCMMYSTNFVYISENDRKYMSPELYQEVVEELMKECKNIFENKFYLQALGKMLNSNPVDRISFTDLCKIFAKIIEPEENQVPLLSPPTEINKKFFIPLSNLSKFSDKMHSAREGPQSNLNRRKTEDQIPHLENKFAKIETSSKPSKKEGSNSPIKFQPCFLETEKNEKRVDSSFSSTTLPITPEKQDKESPLKFSPQSQEKPPLTPNYEIVYFQFFQT